MTVDYNALEEELFSTFVDTKNSRPASITAEQIKIEYYATAKTGAVGSFGRAWMPVCGGNSKGIEYPGMPEGTQRVRFSYAGDDENTAAYDYYVPRLILQPIVENAIIHGLEEKIEGAQVLIEVDIAEDMIITVSDNGRGMSLKELDELNGRIHSEITGLVEEDKSHGTGIALPNINKRIQLLFGEKYGLNVYSSEGCGTDVELILPTNHHAEERV